MDRNLGFTLINLSSMNGLFVEQVKIDKGQKGSGKVGCAWVAFSNLFLFHVKLFSIIVICLPGPNSAAISTAEPLGDLGESTTSTTSTGGERWKRRERCLVRIGRPDGPKQIAQAVDTRSMALWTMMEHDHPQYPP